MTKGTQNRIWLVSLLLALASNAVATTLTLRYDNGTTFVETNRVMSWELALFGRWVPIFAGLMLAAVYCGIWYFTIRRPVSSDMRRFMSFILFFIPALTLQDAIGDVSLVFAGIPLLPLQGIEFSTVVYAVAFVLSQWGFRRKHPATHVP
ncbi:MAG TPA: hypothetical protein VEC92_03475 [Nitrososphaerales archaeon]|nr:hypothetical protein [Nitrososphaerales archaeon]